MSHADRQARYRDRHPEWVSGDNNRRRASRPPRVETRNPSWLMTSEKRHLRAAGLDPSGLRAETGRPTVLYGGSEGPELYCSDGYLQGEPCPHGCWST